MISRAKKGVASKSVFVLGAGEMNGDLALSQGREEGFFDIIKPRAGGECSAKKNCYSHQLVGLGLLKHLSKGIWQRATRVLSFTNSSLG